MNIFCNKQIFLKNKQIFDFYQIAFNQFFTKHKQNKL